jgi:hypothetical protein
VTHWEDMILWEEEDTAQESELQDGRWGRLQQKRKKKKKKHLVIGKVFEVQERM